MGVPSLPWPWMTTAISTDEDSPQRATGDIHGHRVLPQANLRLRLVPDRRAHWQWDQTQTPTAKSTAEAEVIVAIRFGGKGVTCLSSFRIIS